MTTPTPREALEWLRTGATQGPNAEADAVLTALVERHEKLVLTDEERVVVRLRREEIATREDLLVADLITRAYTEPRP